MFYHIKYIFVVKPDSWQKSTWKCPYITLHSKVYTLCFKNKLLCTIIACNKELNWNVILAKKLYTKFLFLPWWFLLFFCDLCVSYYKWNFMMLWQRFVRILDFVQPYLRLVDPPYNLVHHLLVFYQMISNTSCQLMRDFKVVFGVFLCRILLWR